MEFKLNLKDYFKKPITKIDCNLIPEGFNPNDRRVRSYTQSLSEIIDHMGIASAQAQGLMKPITSSEKLRNSEHIVYMYVDHESHEGKGSVLGLLKVGRKHLYVFDREGECHETVALCVLDFYIHESRQRVGCGKILFDYMLKEENVNPVELAIDKPSDKFLSFLKKHYGLSDMIQQTNNFVVYEGFFPSKKEKLTDGCGYRRRSLTMSPNPPCSPGSMNNVTFFGRHAAHKREATIGQIIHSSPVL